MALTDNKHDYWKGLKELLQNAGYTVGEAKDINCGLQFNASLMEMKILVRIYESKKGVTLDLSQIKNEMALNNFLECIEGSKYAKTEALGKTYSTGLKGKQKSAPESEDPEELIGTDESGKGDYFGPLVIAGVFGNLETSKKLMEMGVADSKKLSDSQISLIAPEIKKLCPFSIVVIGNEKYNELYGKIKNLNKLLAWGHARAIENVLEKTKCQYALSDQFGDPSLIEKALLEKGTNIILSQRHRAEENVIVAAASILARCEFVSRLAELEKSYGMQFPKGCSTMTVNAARDFVKRLGISELVKVSKLHFKTTEEL